MFYYLCFVLSHSNLTSGSSFRTAHAQRLRIRCQSWISQVCLYYLNGIELICLITYFWKIILFLIKLKPLSREHWKQNKWMGKKWKNHIKEMLWRKGDKQGNSQQSLRILCPKCKSHRTFSYSRTVVLWADCEKCTSGLFILVAFLTSWRLWRRYSHI